MQNPQFGSKIKIPKNMSKYILQLIYSCFVIKTAKKNTKYSRNESILRIGHHAKAIAHAKSQFGSELKIPKKHVKIHSTTHLKLFCDKKRSKTHEKFEK